MNQYVSRDKQSWFRMWIPSDQTELESDSHPSSPASDFMLPFATIEMVTVEDVIHDGMAAPV